MRVWIFGMLLLAFVFSLAFAVELRSVIQTSDGGYVAVGSNSLYKFDDEENRILSINPTKDGGYILLGYLRVQHVGIDPVLMKLNSRGIPLSASRLTGNLCHLKTLLRIPSITFSVSIISESITTFYW